MLTLALSHPIALKIQTSFGKRTRLPGFGEIGKHANRCIDDRPDKCIIFTMINKYESLETPTIEVDMI